MGCFFNDTATTEIYTLSLHDALPICVVEVLRGEAADLAEPLNGHGPAPVVDAGLAQRGERGVHDAARSEEHTSELQSRQYLVCRLLLEKKIMQHFQLTRATAGRHVSS